MSTRRFNPELKSIPTATITEINQVIYTTATVILQILGYKMKGHKEQYPVWIRRLEVKIKVS